MILADAPTTRQETPGIVSAAWRYRSLSIAFVAFGALAGLVLSLAVAPQANAEAQVTLVDPANPGFRASSASTAAGVSSYTQETAKLFESADVLNAASSKEVDATDLRDSCNVRPSESSFTLTITCSDDSSDAAVAKAEALIDAYRKVSSRLNADRAEVEVRALESEREEIETALSDPNAEPNGTQSRVYAERLIRLSEDISDVRTDSELMGDGVRFVDPPRAISAISPPARLVRNVIAGAVLGLVAAIALAWILAARRPLAERIDDAREALGSEPLARVSREHDLFAHDLFDISGSDVQLVASQIESMYDQGVFLCSDPHRVVGRAELLISTAAGIAQMGKRVLVVEADPAREVCSAIGIHDEWGISDLLAGVGTRSDRAISISFERSPGLGESVLRFMGPGALTDRLGPLARTPRAATVFGELREKNDYVFVVLPPILDSSLGTAFGRIGDGIVMAVEQSTALTTLEETRRRLESYRLPTIGFVVVSP